MPPSKCSCDQKTFTAREEEEVKDKIPVHFKAKIHAIQNVDERVGTVKVVVRSYLFWEDLKLRQIFREHHAELQNNKFTRKVYKISESIEEKMNPSRPYYFGIQQWPPGVDEIVPSLDLFGTQDKSSYDASELELRFLENSWVMLTQLHVTLIVVKFDLHQFPFDCNNIEMRFWIRKSKDKNRFYLSPCFCSCLNISVDESLDEGTVITVAHNCADSLSGFKNLRELPNIREVHRHKTYPPKLYNLIFLVPLHRKSIPWMYRYAGPPILVAILAASSNAVPYWNFWDRASVNLALLLTLFTMHISHGQELPKVNYMTPIDNIFMFSIFLIFVITIENWVLAKFYSCQELHAALDQGCKDRIASADDTFYLISMIIWVVLIIGLFRQVIKFVILRRMKAKEEKERDANGLAHLPSHDSIYMPGRSWLC